MDEQTEDIAKRGSKGGTARKEKLSPERRKEIAKEAAAKRWEKVREDKERGILPANTFENSDLQVEHANSKTVKTSEPSAVIDAEFPEVGEIVSDAPKEKHCPACLLGKRLDEGDHILATVEHPVIIPPILVDTESNIDAPRPPAPQQKAPKHPKKAIPKEFKSASSYAEKRLPLAIKEKSDHVGAVARLDAEINDLVRVIKALGGGTVEPQVEQAKTYPPYGISKNNVGPVAIQPGYQTAISATPIDIPSAPKPMRVGGAGIAAGIPEAWLNE